MSATPADHQHIPPEPTRFTAPPGHEPQPTGGGGTLSERDLSLPPSSILRVGVYEVLEELGRGGMGIVYKARHLQLGHEVALKMILAGTHANDQELARFRIEAAAVARLKHPNIVHIHDFGEHDDHLFFSLEFIEGGNLAGRLKNGPLPPREIAVLVEKLARAMQHAHQKGIIHRDLKPANVLLTKEGEPKVTDFGLAKQMEAEDGPSRTGAQMGTPAYMAPEQAAGRVHETCPQTDVWALGVILYESLTCQLPFKGTSQHETMQQVLTAEPIPPRRLNPRLPRDLETICLRCLEKEPNRRYSSAEALAEELRRFSGGEPILARPISTLERGIKWVRRRPALAALLAVICVAAVTLTGVILDANFRLQHERDHARNMEEKANGERNMALEARNEADRQRLKVSELLSHTSAERGRRLLESGNGLGLLDLLEARRAADELPTLCDAQTVLWSRWATGCAGRLEQVLPNESPVTALAFAADGKTLATRVKDGAGSILLWDLGTGTARTTIATPREWMAQQPLGAAPLQEHLAFSTNGSALVFRWHSAGPAGGACRRGTRPAGAPLPTDQGRRFSVKLSQPGWTSTCGQHRRHPASARREHRPARRSLLEGRGQGYHAPFQP